MTSLLLLRKSQKLIIILTFRSRILLDIFSISILEGLSFLVIVNFIIISLKGTSFIRTLPIDILINNLITHSSKNHESIFCYLMIALLKKNDN